MLYNSFNSFILTVVEEPDWRIFLKESFPLPTKQLTLIITVILLLMFPRLYCNLGPISLAFLRYGGHYRLYRITFCYESRHLVGQIVCAFKHVHQWSTQHATFPVLYTAHAHTCTRTQTDRCCWADIWTVTSYSLKSIGVPCLVWVYGARFTQTQYCCSIVCYFSKRLNKAA